VRLEAVRTMPLDTHQAQRRESLGETPRSTGWGEELAVLDVHLPSPDAAAAVAVDVSRRDVPPVLSSSLNRAVRRSSGGAPFPQAPSQSPVAPQGGSSPTSVRVDFEHRHLQLCGARATTTESSARALDAGRQELFAREDAAREAAAHVQALRTQAAQAARAGAEHSADVSSPAYRGISSKALDAALVNAAAADAALWTVRKEHASLSARHAAIAGTLAGKNGSEAVKATTAQAALHRSGAGAQVLVVEATAAAAAKLRGHAAERDSEVIRLKAHARRTARAVAETQTRLDAARQLNAQRTRELETATAQRDDAGQRLVAARDSVRSRRSSLASLGPEAGLVSSPLMLAELRATQAEKAQLEATVTVLKNRLDSLTVPVR
jgi:hypothetical protein